MERIKVLLIDDDEDDFVLTRDILRENDSSNDYELSWCDNYREAINTMLKGEYDIYLVDYRLGRDSGLDLLNEAVKSNCTEPIIVLTGKGDLEIDQNAMRLGAADYLLKDNITAQTLERSIRYAISNNKILQQLKNSEKKFRIIFERSKDPMLITNSEGRIIEANSAAFHFFETTLTDLLKVNTASLYKNPADREAYLNEMNVGGAITDLEVQLRTLQGKDKFCSISSFVQVSQHATEELYYSIIHDLTYRLQQETEDVLNDQLEATERIAKKLSAEIQNPLSNVNLAVEEFNDLLTGEEHLALLSIIKENCEKINSLTTDLIESTQTSSLNLSDLNLKRLVDDLVESIKSTSYLSINNLTDNTVTLKADEASLKKALTAILENAIEAITPGSEQINIQGTRKASHLKIEISDNGRGIPTESLSKIFEPFYTTKAKSAGLGLTRAQRIVHTHKGKIHISSQPGAGTVVSILLPQSDS